MSKKDPVNEMKLWKDRVEGEYAVAAEWENNWGFLKASKPETVIAEERHQAEERFQVAEDPDNFSPKTKSDLGDDTVELTAKLRFTINRGKTPKEKQARPHTTSQEIGWRPSVELFGVSQNGIKRNQELWPQ